MAAVEAVAQLDGMLLKGGREKRVMQRMPPAPPSPLQITAIEPEHWGRVFKTLLPKVQTTVEGCDPFFFFFYKQLRTDTKLVFGNSYIKQYIEDVSQQVNKGRCKQMPGCWKILFRSEWSCIRSAIDPVVPTGKVW